MRKILFRSYTSIHIVPVPTQDIKVAGAEWLPRSLDGTRAVSSGWSDRFGVLQYLVLSRAVRHGHGRLDKRLTEKLSWELGKPGHDS